MSYLFGTDGAGNTIDFGNGSRMRDYDRLIEHMNEAARAGRDDGVNDVVARTAYNANPFAFTDEAKRAHNLGNY